MQKLRASRLCVVGAAGAQLYAKFLDGGGGVTGVNVLRERTKCVCSLAERLKLEAQLRERLAVCLKRLGILRRKAHEDRLQERLTHDLTLALHKPVKDHALVGCVLINEQQFPVKFDENVCIQRLTDETVGGRGDFFNSFNCFFNIFAFCRSGKSAVIFRHRTAKNGALRRPCGGGLKHGSGSFGKRRTGKRCAGSVVKCRRGAFGELFCPLRKAYLKGLVLRFEGAAHGLIHGVKDLFLFGKLHLCLCGVYIYVDCGVAECEVYDAGGKAPREQRIAVRLLDGGLQKRRTDIPSVAEEILSAAAALTLRRGGHKALDRHAVGTAPTGKQGACKLPAEQGIHGGIVPCVAGGEKLLRPVSYAAHGDFGPAEGAVQRRSDAGGSLAPVAFEELEPCGGVEENVPHGDARPLRAAAGQHIDDVARLDGHFNALVGAFFTGAKLDAADRRNGGKSLASKAHRADGFKPPLVVKLARCVPHEGDAGVLGAHAAAVVTDAYVGSAAVFELDRHLFGTCVEGVFHKLLYDRGGTFDDLACGDHVRQMRRKNVYPCHGYLWYNI